RRDRQSSRVAQHPDRDPDREAAGGGGTGIAGRACAGDRRKERRRSGRSSATCGAAADPVEKRPCHELKQPMPKILIVEDNEMNRDMLSRRLERRGYEIVTALDGEQGVAAAQSENPDLILMDMSLPVMDGWEATRRLKTEAATSRIPVIGLTAHAMTGDRDKAMAAGCDDYDTKPVELPRLLGKIESLLGRSGPAG